jgi:hypothetical protein
MGLFLATFVDAQIAGLDLEPTISWRFVFLCGLIPAAAAFFVRLFVKEPERWKKAAETAAAPRIAELFSPRYRALTISGFCMAVTALIMWWSCNAFIPVVATGMAQETAKAQGLDKGAAADLVKHWKVIATNSFNLGGLIGTLLTIPAAKYLGRKPMFKIYFLLSAVSLMAAFGLPMDNHTRLYMYFPIGLTVFGVFGSFTYYLPELFPTRLRGTGAGFCYNVGRIIASIGPFLVGWVASQGKDSLHLAMSALFYVGFVPLVGLLTMPLVIETKGHTLTD